MPSKTICCGEKAVVVSLYVEGPRKGSSETDKHHHYHRIRKRPTHHKLDGGPNRRANLLLYSQHLRETATVQSATPSPPHPASNDPQPISKIIPAGSKHKNSRTPTCLGDLRALIPRFIRSLAGLSSKKEKKKEHSRSTPNKMNTVIKSLDVKKKLGFVTKLLKTLRKRRFS
ncbi:uncharacterized protein LOC131232856 [Magnolia sinica]|uniref:uncharacterized protein LOC131232856 n=1 Tax=Magnolia sinica TaxID=86752 RepID=UPI0026583F0B|nr:uncharacterized protein LOC131232856 [Magnolia sinica]